MRTASRIFAFGHMGLLVSLAGNVLIQHNYFEHSAQAA